MLPGWMMPIDEVIKMVLNAPPYEGCRILASLPPDRLQSVLNGMQVTDLARVLATAREEHRAELSAKLPPQQLTGMLRTMPEDQAALLLSALSTKRILTVMNSLSDAEVAMLLEAMRPQQRSSLLAAMDPYQAAMLRSMLYERRIAQVLARTNVRVALPPGGRGDALLVEVSGRTILLSIHFIDEGEFTTRELSQAEELARRARTHGLLAVTNAPVSREIGEHRFDRPSRAGRPADVVVWTDPGQDGALLRALVSLVR